MSSRRNRQQLIEALNAAMREVSGQGVLYSQAVAERLAVNSTDLECLDYILAGGAITAGALAEATGLTTGAITGVIDRLERRGFARRERDAGDRRKVLVRALPSVVEEIGPLFAPMERAALGALSAYRESDLELLLDFLARIRAAAAAAMAELQTLPPAKPKPRGPREPHTAQQRSATPAGRSPSPLAGEGRGEESTPASQPAPIKAPRGRRREPSP
jgi:DNA-binding MarR family transcriptional regulator